MNFEKEYVMGFAFDPYGAVALINKNRPDWQKGKWNGIGGHLEHNELAHEAMAREFQEETGMATKLDDWVYVGVLQHDNVSRCRLFTATFPLLKVYTATDEQVRVFTPTMQQYLGSPDFPAMENLALLFEMCRLPPNHKGKVPLFELNYTDGRRA